MSVLRTVTTTVFGLALVGAVFSPGAKADEWNKKTVMTFSAPVEIPGVHLKGWGVLPAGTYVFKLWTRSPTGTSSRSSTRKKPCYATILAIPNYRLRATGKTVVTFRERPAGLPEALRAWFYPGRIWGEEFVYPRRKLLSWPRRERPGSCYDGRFAAGSRGADLDSGRAGGGGVETGAHYRS